MKRAGPFNPINNLDGQNPPAKRPSPLGPELDLAIKRPRHPPPHSEHLRRLPSHEERSARSPPPQPRTHVHRTIMRCEPTIPSNGSLERNRDLNIDKGSTSSGKRLQNGGAKRRHKQRQTARSASPPTVSVNPASTPDPLAISAPTTQGTLLRPTNNSAMTSVRLLDYDEEYMTQPMPDNSIRVEDRNSQNDPITDQETGIRQKRENDEKHDQVGRKKQRAAANIASLVMADRAQVGEDVSRGESPRLSYSFRRASGNDSRDELGHSCSPILSTQLPSKKSSITTLGEQPILPMQHAPKQSKALKGSGDGLTERAHDQRRRKRLTNASKNSGFIDLNDNDQLSMPRLISFWHETEFSPPLALFIGKGNTFFKVTGEGDRTSCINLIEVQVFCYSGNSVQLYMKHPKSQSAADIEMTFDSKNSTEHFVRIARLLTLGYSGIKFVESDSPTKRKTASKQLADTDVDRKDSNSGGPTRKDEEKLLAARAQNKLRNGMHLATVSAADRRAMTRRPHPKVEHERTKKSANGAAHAQDYQSRSSRRREAGTNHKTYESQLADDGARTAANQQVANHQSRHVNRPAGSLVQCSRTAGGQAIRDRLAPRSSEHEHGTLENAGFPDTDEFFPPWTTPLVYPRNGRNKVTVDFEDLKRLREDEFLNDNLVQFGLRYIEENFSNTAEEVYMFNTYFYTSLTKDCKGRKNINYEAVKKWTAKFDLFKYNHLIIPINERLHWYLAIVCNLRNARRLPNLDLMDGKDCNGQITRSSPSHELIDSALLGDHEQSAEDQDKLLQGLAGGSLSRNNEKDREHDVRQITNGHAFLEQHTTLKAQSSVPASSPRLDPVKSTMTRKLPGGKTVDETSFAIVTLDSFGAVHGNVIRNLKDYLREEAKTKRFMNIEEPLGMTAKGIPRQDNYSDCGLYLLCYATKCLHNPSSFVRKMLLDKFVARDWEAMTCAGLPHELSTIWRKDLRDRLQEQYEVQQEIQNGKRQGALFTREIDFKSRRKQCNLLPSVVSLNRISPANHSEAEDTSINASSASVERAPSHRPRSAEPPPPPQEDVSKHFKQFAQSELAANPDSSATQAEDPSRGAEDEEKESEDGLQIRPRRASSELSGLDDHNIRVTISSNPHWVPRKVTDYSDWSGFEDNEDDNADQINKGGLKETAQGRCQSVKVEKIDRGKVNKFEHHSSELSLPHQACLDKGVAVKATNNGGPQPHDLIMDVNMLHGNEHRNYSGDEEAGDDADMLDICDEDAVSQETRIDTQPEDFVQQVCDQAFAHDNSMVAEDSTMTDVSLSNPYDFGKAVGQDESPPRPPTRGKGL